MRPVWILAGFCCFIIGAIGIIVPLLPTTPFMLLATFAFARSSDTLHQWLLNHPRFGPSIRDWNAYGVIARRAKIIALLTIFATFLISIIMALPLYILIIQAVVLALVALFIISRPENPPEA